MKRPLPAVSSRTLVALAVLAVTSLLAASPARAQAIIKVNENVSVRLGIFVQAWADWTQDPATMGYSQNLYLHRTRFLMAGQVARNLTFFFDTENPDLGKAPKSLGAGFLIRDFWAEWKITNELRLDAGLIAVPLCRACILSPTSFLTLDSSNLSTLENTVTQSSGVRDTGLGFKGYFLNDHLEYRIYAFQGARIPGSRNAFRLAGRVQYDVFDTEMVYSYEGTNLGKKKILALGVGSDNQGAYHAYSGDVAVDIPVNGGDCIGGMLQWVHYDGEDQFTSLLRQNTYQAELGYYFSKVQVQPFLAFQAQRFSDSVNTSTNRDRYSAGLNYYVSGQNLKFTAQFARNAPNGGIPWTNQFTIQMQVFYF